MFIPYGKEKKQIWLSGTIGPYEDRTRDLRIISTALLTS